MARWDRFPKVFYFALVGVSGSFCCSSLKNLPKSRKAEKPLNRWVSNGLGNYVYFHIMRWWKAWRAHENVLSRCQRHNYGKRLLFGKDIIIHYSFINLILSIFHSVSSSDRWSASQTWLLKPTLPCLFLSSAHATEELLNLLSELPSIRFIFIFSHQSTEQLN